MAYLPQWVNNGFHPIPGPSEPQVAALAAGNVVAAVAFRCHQAKMTGLLTMYMELDGTVAAALAAAPYNFTVVTVDASVNLRKITWT